jgi:hypothetical protein
MMRRRNSGPFLRNRDGSYALNMAPDVRQLLVHMFGELRDVLTEGESNDPMLRRLFPAAYHQDPELDTEYHGLMRGELVASRLAAISRAVEVIETDEALSGDDLVLFMQTLNSLRLLLGTLLDVNENDDPAPFDDEQDDETAAQHHLYAYLGWLLEGAVAAFQMPGGNRAEP